ncbi:MAG: dTDP-glucose 4,6-dehydratase [Oligoflexia bacterium]|nr:dTDP-glucose 4,6-dehydratase [Oligoflexia bacterium]
MKNTNGNFQRILVTGGAGFIGSHFIRLLLNERPSSEVINLDLLTYAGNLENLKDAESNPKYKFIKGDIGNRELTTQILSEVDAVVNFAAESHVDRSILGPEAFIQTNIVGTQRLLDVSKQNKVKRFLQVSTDEVYGSLGAEGAFTEDTPLAPNSPYSASKAAADLLCRAYHHTFALDVVITRCSNNYGPNQFPEKLIPLMISNARSDKPLPVYGDGLNVRDWIHVEDHCRGILAVLENGQSGEVYNIGSNNEWPNIQIVKKILNELKKPESLIKFVADRPGHDRRYAINSSKMKNQLNWEPKIDFSEGLHKTIDWYLKNDAWLRRVTSGEYLKYYETQYSNR